MANATRRRFVQGLGLTALGLASPAAAQTAIPLVVVVNKDCPWVDISLADLWAMFSGEAVQLPGGQKVMPLNDFAGNPARVEFDRRILRMGPEEVGRYWTDRRIRGVSGPPRAVASALIRQKLVERFGEAVTYVRHSELTSHARPVTISGKKPGTSGYALALGFASARPRFG